MSRAGFRVAVLLCMAVGGCVAVDEKLTGPGRFEIAAPASEFINSEERARYLISIRAGELCPTGFDRLRESRIVDAKALETVVWTIVCRNR